MCKAYQRVINNEAVWYYEFYALTSENGCYKTSFHFYNILDSSIKPYRMRALRHVEILIIWKFDWKIIIYIVAEKTYPTFILYHRPVQHRNPPSVQKKKRAFSYLQYQNSKLIKFFNSLTGKCFFSYMLNLAIKEKSHT